MTNNTLIIAAAGSGKTTYLVNEALRMPLSEQVLITTYTEANEAEIRKRFISKKGCVPSNIKIQTWFSFLLQHGVRPFQSVLNESIHEESIGFYLTSNRSGQKVDSEGVPITVGGHPQYWGENHFNKFYFTPTHKIFSDKISKFIVNADKASEGAVLNRVSRLYDHFFIDEVQDLAGFDLEIINLLFKSNSTVLLVGDPRQVTYLTHTSTKYKKYRDGKIKGFVESELGKRITCTVDETTLGASHRNNKQICDFANRIYPDLSPAVPCSCDSCREFETDHEGVFWIKEEDVDQYIEEFHPTQLRWSSAVQCRENAPAMNFGESKGLSFERVLIYPTEKMVGWIKDNSYDLKNETRAKLYVGVTRAKRSTAIVLKSQDTGVDGVERYPAA
ncbi:UvrD-helicase domain-containing protein [Pontiella agarivorans]|uniref:DNA 3'-5' helicase II n=1 Tax=Pontiella agarivorans TaxID=3038953 RepID=A0ABU5MTJ2_9BACT|nr:UvrD-helicase domain-containing protein [Pontiella agarivorans]MDZ8117518.1 UvrD-helicase domain-containing protein [Pontiella agarivorans]